MNRTAIRIVLVLGILAIAGIIGVQFYFIRQATDQESRQVNQAISLALTSVAEDLARYNDAELPRQNPVFHHSPDYYIVNVNTHIDPQILEQFLITEFRIRGLHLDFEYGIYDCVTDQMVYGRLVRFGENPRIKPMEQGLPKSADYMYYFGIHFAGKNRLVMDSMGIWIFFSGILLLVIIFFVYTQMVILRQRRFTEVQRDFIHTMTHEFKTPLASLSMSAEVIGNPKILKEPERLKKYGEIIRTQVNHLLRQVELVLESGNYPGSRKSIRKVPVRLKPFLEEICTQMEPRVTCAQGTLELNYVSTREWVEADPVHLTNILFNLLDNSIKYSGDHPAVRIDVADEGRRMMVRIADNGPGIPPKHRNRVFERFYRVPAANNQAAGGFGLGLYYTLHAVRAHGWSVRIGEASGGGTLVTLTIPVKSN